MSRTEGEDIYIGTRGGGVFFTCVAIHAMYIQNRAKEHKMLDTILSSHL